MTMIILMFVAALALSGVAAFYAIVGLMAIFAAAPIPIAIMGSLLEGSKLVVASWLYRNWKEIPILLKSYFVAALMILMFLTSMGIFGFLSKSHLDQAVPTDEVAAKIATIDEKINIEKEIINESRKALDQLDNQVNQTIARTATQTDDKGVRRSITIRKQQANERAALRADIEASQKKIAGYQETRAPIATQLRQVEAEVGPIKYIAALIYDETDQTILEKAVRGVILLIVAVLDPLAVLMLIAANWSLVHRKKPEEEIPAGWHKELVPDSEAWPEWEWDEPTEEDPSTEEFFQEGKDLAKHIDENDGTVDHAYLKTPWRWMKNNYGHTEWETPPPPETPIKNTAEWISRPPVHKHKSR